jgi:hypothetical protein
MAVETCHGCVYSTWDLGQAMQGLSMGWVQRPMCANHPDTPGLMRPTPLGETCRNYRTRPATPEGDVKRIPLGNGLYAYVDAADYERLSRYRWCVVSGGYVARRSKNKWILRHREFMQPPEGMVVDHHDCNKANNCRFNLRVCRPAENQHNRTKRPGTSSRFMGVSYVKRDRKYCAVIDFHGRRFWLGYFKDEVEAARAYDHKAVECCGPFARVNLPDEWPPERIRQVYAPREADQP